MAESISLEEPTVGQRVGARIGEGIDNVIDSYQGAKQHISAKAASLSNKGKAVHRLNRMKFNRSKEAAKQMYADAKMNVGLMGMVAAGAVADGYGYVKDKASEFREGVGVAKQHISEKAASLIG